MKADKVKKLFRAMPACLSGTAADDAKDIREAIDAAQTEIDIWEEGNESELTKSDIKKIKVWIARIKGEIS